MSFFFFLMTEVFANADLSFIIFLVLGGVRVFLWILPSTSAACSDSEQQRPVGRDTSDTVEGLGGGLGPSVWRVPPGERDQADLARLGLTSLSIHLLGYGTSTK